MKLASFVAMAMATVSFAARAADPPAQVAAPEIHTLEGILNEHPKFLYRYYLTGFGGGQSCALFGWEKQLQEIKPGARIRVKGILGTRSHRGGTAGNPSPFPATTFIFMNVNSVEVFGKDPAEETIKAELQRILAKAKRDEEDGRK